MQETKSVAGEQYTCCECLGEINKGDPYIRTKRVDGSLWSLRQVCESCWLIINICKWKLLAKDMNDIFENIEKFTDSEELLSLLDGKYSEEVEVKINKILEGIENDKKTANRKERSY